MPAAAAESAAQTSWGNFVEGVAFLKNLLYNDLPYYLKYKYFRNSNFAFIEHGYIHGCQNRFSMAQ
jgi:hypothetical protein